MSDDHNFTLIKGQFTLDEGREILMNLINRKIEFHNLKIIRTFEKKGIEDLDSQKRIQELEKTRNNILSLLKLKNSDEVLLNIDSSMHVTIHET